MSFGQPLGFDQGDSAILSDSASVIRPNSQTLPVSFGQPLRLGQCHSANLSDSAKVIRPSSQTRPMVTWPSYSDLTRVIRPLSFGLGNCHSAILFGLGQDDSAIIFRLGQSVSTIIFGFGHGHSDSAMVIRTWQLSFGHPMQTRRRHMHQHYCQQQAAHAECKQDLNQRLSSRQAKETAMSLI